MNHLHELRRLFAATAWAIEPRALRAMIASADLLATGGPRATEHVLAALEAEKAVQAARRQQISASTGGAVAVLPLYGVISQRSSWMSYFFGGTTTEGFTQQFREALANDSVTAIVIDVDSPGGSVAGVDELAAEIYAGRSRKKIVAISNTLNASAAYYLSSAATELVVMPSSVTGSIGVYQQHEDDSKALDNLGIKLTLIAAGKYKVEGNSLEPLTDEARAAMQQMVDGYYAMFVKAVARGRGVKVADVVNGFGEGRCLMAADAVKCGMADRIGTLDTVLAGFGVKRPVNGSEAASTGVQPLTETSLDVQALESSSPVQAADVSKAVSKATRVKKAAKKDNPADDQNTDDVGDDDDELLCACECAPCVEGDCKGCTVVDCDLESCGCHGEDAGEDGDATEKAKAEQAYRLALQRQWFHFNASAEINTSSE